MRMDAIKRMIKDSCPFLFVIPLNLPVTVGIVSAWNKGDFKLFIPKNYLSNSGVIRTMTAKMVLMRLNVK